MKTAWNVLLGKPEEKDYLEDADTDGDNIKKDPIQIWCEHVDWIHLAHDRIQRWVLVNSVMNILYHKRWNFLTSWATISFSRRTLLHGVTCFNSCNPLLDSVIWLTDKFMFFHTIYILNLKTMWKQHDKFRSSALKYGDQLYYITFHYIPWIHSQSKWLKDVEQVIQIQKHIYSTSEAFQKYVHTHIN
jgi:hypothetical protein